MFTAQILSAQYVIKGVVRSEAKGVTLSDVYVQTESGAYFFTDTEGTFAIPSKSDGQWLTFVHPSFEQKSLYCTASKTTEVILADALILLNTIIVSRSPSLEDPINSVLNERVRSGSFARTASDLFEHAPGFSMIKRSSFASEPVFRGLREDRLNVMYDGGVKVMHACPNRMDPITTHVMPEEISEIEVIKGPFSVLYGPNFGGTINMITEPVTAADAKPWHGMFLMGGASNAPSLFGRAKLGFHSKYLDVGGMGAVLQNGNYLTGKHDGSRDTIPAHFKTRAFSLYTNVRPSSADALQVNFRHSAGLDIAHVGLPMDSKHNNSDVYSLKYARKMEDRRVSRLSLLAYHSKVDHLMSNAERTNASMVEAATQVYAMTTGGKVRATSRVDAVRLDYGVDMYRLDRAGERTRKIKRLPPDHPKTPGKVLDKPKFITDTIWPEASQSIIGAFLQMDWTPSSRWNVKAGVRGDYFNARAEALPRSFVQKAPSRLDPVTFIGWSGHLNAKCLWTSHHIFQLALGRGVRFPSMEEQYIQHLAVGAEPFEYVGNPAVVPEVNHQIDVGVKWIYPEVQVFLNAYYSRISDYILPVVDAGLHRKFLPWRAPTAAKTYTNLDAAILRGVEWQARASLPGHLSLTMGLAYTEGQNIDWDTPLPLMAPLRVNAGLRYAHAGYFIEIAGRYSAKQDRVDTSFGETVSPAYTLLDLKCGMKWRNHLKCNISVSNLLDVGYYDHLNFSYKNAGTLKGRIYNPGRSVSLSVQYDF